MRKTWEKHVYITSKIVWMSTSFNKSDDKSKKLEEQSKKRRCKRERAKAKLRWLKLLNSRDKKSSTRRKYATVLRARIARVFSSELTAGDKRSSEADREKGGAIAEI